MKPKKLGKLKVTKYFGVFMRNTLQRCFSDKTTQKTQSPSAVNDEIKVLNKNIGYLKFGEISKSFYVVDENNRNVGQITSVSDVGRAFVGDKVVYEIYPGINQRGFSCVRIVSVIKRNQNLIFIGKLTSKIVGKSRVLEVQKMIPTKVLVSLSDPLLDCQGDNVWYAGRFLEWPENCEYPAVRLIHRSIISNYVNVEDENRLLALQKGLIDFIKYAESDLKIKEFSNLEKNSDRLDLTGECVFSIDPENSADADDAISCKILMDGKIQVGVHIADVTHFVPVGSEVDLRARQLCNTLYLPHRVYHMLPLSLSADLCSLNPGVNRYTISVLMTFDKDLKLVDTWMGRTIINSCAKLSYEQAQSIIASSECSSDIDLSIHNGFNKLDVEKSIRELFKISNRIEDLKPSRYKLNDLKKVEVKFELDSDNHPVKFYMKDYLESNLLVENLMVMSNVIVGEKIFKEYPCGSIFRVQQPVNGPNLELRVKTLQQYGFEIGSTLASNLSQYSIEIEKTYGQEISSVVQHFLSLSNNKAYYQLATSEHDINAQDRASFFHHDSMGINIYTHFTSPIRRYADILVHRLLINALEGKKDSIESLEMLKTLIQCNERSTQTKKMEEQSCLFHLWLFLKKNGPMKFRASFIPADAISTPRGLHNIILLPYFFKISYTGSMSIINEKRCFTVFDIIVGASDTKSPFCVESKLFTFEIVK
ncbi:DIS3-like exonuclease 2 [Thelohanellus kitauei]|uniref:DIS3-like exonuclease 2 n=1 Tax=Thelohanellus kitauei TaxID=669202 RepID=A0A0C2JB55_THEKT|nr:DIS3-like exonuclease 2 [Thelohanellus kitauei]